jgi:hypothetical protein
MLKIIAINFVTFIQEFSNDKRTITNKDFVNIVPQLNDFLLFFLFGDRDT